MNTVTITLYKGVFAAHLNGVMMQVGEWDLHLAYRLNNGLGHFPNNERPVMDGVQIGEADTLLWMALGGKALQFVSSGDVPEAVEDYIFDITPSWTRHQRERLIRLIAEFCNFSAHGMPPLDPAAHERRISGLAEHELITKI